MPSRLAKLEDCLRYDEIMKQFIYIQVVRLNELKYIESHNMAFLAKRIKPQYRLRQNAIDYLEGLHEQIKTV